VLASLDGVISADAVPDYMSACAKAFNSQAQAASR